MAQGEPVVRKECGKTFPRRSKMGPKPVFCVDCREQRNYKQTRVSAKKWRERNLTDQQRKDRESKRRYRGKVKGTPEYEQRRIEYQRKAFDKKLREKYGINRDAYEAMKEEQKGRCAICGQKPLEAGTRKSLVVDHDHHYLLVRQLLCHRCNVALGLFDDDPVRIREAAAYLEFWKDLHSDYRQRQDEWHEGQE